MRAAPIVKWMCTEPVPHEPLPAFHPSRFDTTSTVVPEGQKSLGRKCSSLLENHLQPPLTCGVVVTVKCDSAAAWAVGSVTGWLNFTTTGCATPTSRPSGHNVALTFDVGFTVLNVVVACATTPSLVWSVVSIVYERFGWREP